MFGSCACAHALQLSTIMSAHGFSACCRTSRCSSWAMSSLYRTRRAAVQGSCSKIGLLKCMLLRGYQRLQARSHRWWIVN